MMKIADLHTHTALCGHAGGKPEEYLAQAEKREVAFLGVSDHAPWPDGYDPLSRMRPEQYPEYRELVKKLQQSDSPVQVLYSIEMDWVPGRMNRVLPFVENENYDYVIGSVHYIDDFPFDNPDIRAEWEKPNMPAYVWNKYGEALSNFVDFCDFDIIAHPDLPKKFGYRPVFDKNFIGSMSSIFERAAKKNMALEINTAGLYKEVGEIYPSPELLKLAKKAGMRITFGSDAHAPCEVARNFTDAVALAKSVGFDSFTVFKKRVPYELPFD